MDGLLSLLIFAGLFFLMMRFGCGAHLMRGRRHHQEEAHRAAPRNRIEGRHLDPVCGQPVNSSEGYGKMHDDQLYRFCSRQCLDVFEAEPGRFTNRGESVTP